MTTLTMSKRVIVIVASWLRLDVFKLSEKGMQVAVHSALTTRTNLGGGGGTLPYQPSRGHAYL